MHSYPNEKKLDKSYFRIHLDKDISLENISVFVDDKKYIIPLTNKGVYSMFINYPFKTIKCDCNYRCFVKEINESIDEFLLSYNYHYDYSTVKKEYDSVHIIKNKNYLFEEYPTKNCVCIRESFRNILKLTRYYTFSKSDTLLADIQYCLDFMFKHWYTGKDNYQDNWWDYEIGSLKILNEIFINLYAVVDKNYILEKINITKFYLADPSYIFYRKNYPKKERKKATLANLADNISNYIIRCAIENDNTTIKNTIHLLKSTMNYVSFGDGIYKDGSFIQHESIPYTISYGESFITAIANAIEFYDALKENITGLVKKIKSIIKNTYIPLLYQNIGLDCARGRSIARKTFDGYYFGNRIIDAITKIANITQDNELLEILSTMNQENVFIFNYMDRYVKKYKNSCVTISCYSKYIDNFECMNSENLKGYYFSNNAMMIYNEKTNYQNGYFPTVNPFYISGSTNTLKPVLQKNMTNNLTAGVKYKKMAIVGFDSTQDVYGKFTTIFLENSILCLGSEIECEEKYVTTIINIPVKDYFIKNKRNIVVNDIEIISQHDVEIEEVIESGSYHDVNSLETSDLITMKYVKCYLNNPKNYLYQINLQGKDSYEVMQQTSNHLVKSGQVYFGSMFDKNGLEVENIKISGIGTFIKYKENLIFSTGKREPVNIKISGLKKITIVSNLKIIDLDDKNKIIEICDECEHIIKVF